MADIFTKFLSKVKFGKMTKRIMGYEEEPDSVPLWAISERLESEFKEKDK